MPRRDFLMRLAAHHVVAPWAWADRAISARRVATSTRKSCGTIGCSAADHRAAASGGRGSAAHVSIQAAMPLRTNNANPIPRPDLPARPSALRRSSS
jgi:hypothetical protein